ncbi:MAG: hypothetical protein WAQ52_02005 [Terriglobales bacterium]
MAYGFEFDPVNKILLFRWEGRLADESFAESQPAIRKYWAATNPSAGIDDYSSVTEFAVSTKAIHELADQELVGDASGIPRVIVAPATIVFGMARMFQILGERKRPDLKVVRTMDEALAALGVRSPRFEPLR